ncbi:MAG: TraR/DksA C4-type zinc finger protein [Candidatus Paceibacterota bacterium]|jgi:DnaK suppressor protein
MNTQHFKELLEKEKMTLEGELKGLGVKDKKTGDWEATPEGEFATEPDENDRADRFEDFEERSSTLNELEARLREIEEGLAKIADGSYGICIVCNNPIEEDRLEANASAKTCIAHKEM